MSSTKNYYFKLFIAGMNSGSFHAIENVREICDTYLSDGYDLEVIDIYQQRQLLKDMNIIAVPTLVRVKPAPEVRIIGDMLNKKEITKILEFKEK
ncbi:MAG: circadian clock KaiB family protein [Tangfeifania sp.]